MARHPANTSLLLLLERGGTAFAAAAAALRRYPRPVTSRAEACKLDGFDDDAVLSAAFPNMTSSPDFVIVDEDAPAAPTSRRASDQRRRVPPRSSPPVDSDVVVVVNDAPAPASRRTSDQRRRVSPRSSPPVVGSGVRAPRGRRSAGAVEVAAEEEELIIILDEEEEGGGGAGAGAGAGARVRSPPLPRAAQPARAPADAASPSACTCAPRSRTVDDARTRPCLLDSDAWDVVLLLDTREVRSKEDRTYPLTRLQSHRGVIVEQRQLPLGDAVWVVRRRSSALRAAAADADGAGGAPKARSKKAAAAAGDGGSEFSDGRGAKKGAKACVKKAAKPPPPPLLGSDEYMLGHVLERKTIRDLAASIKDTRYTEQKLRLAACGMRVTYLVEGDPHSYIPDPPAPAGGGRTGGRPPIRPGVNSKHILGALASTAILGVAEGGTAGSSGGGAGCHVVVTPSLDSSLSFMAAMHEAIDADFRRGARCATAPPLRAPPLFDAIDAAAERLSVQAAAARTAAAGSGSGGTCTRCTRAALSSAVPCPVDACALRGRSGIAAPLQTYASWAAASARPRFHPARFVWGAALRQVRGFSGMKVEAVLNAYPTPSALYRTYAALAMPALQGGGLLEDLPIPGQKRRLGPTASAELCDVVWGGGGGKKLKGGGSAADEEEDDE